MNITNEQLNKTLSQFFGDKETAQKFADAMRKGLKPQSYTNALSDELARWCEWQGLECKSVDEMLLSSNLSYYQRDYLQTFEFRWEGAEEHEEDADEAALKELNEELRELMELQGFTLWQTGGGCTAWGKYLLGGNNDKSPYMMIALDDCSEFTSLADAHRKDALMVCFYNSDGDWLGSSDSPIYYSWDEFKQNFKGGF